MLDYGEFDTYQLINSDINNSHKSIHKITLNFNGTILTSIIYGNVDGCFTRSNIPRVSE